MSKIPGFRSGSKIKATAATIGYSLIGLMLLGSVSGDTPPHDVKTVPVQQEQQAVQLIEDEHTPTPQPTLIPTLTPTTKPTRIRVQPTKIPPTEPAANTSNTSSCSIEKTCGQMTSCEEAYFYLHTCGHSKRDGDGDGVPCESICPGG